MAQKLAVPGILLTAFYALLCFFLLDYYRKKAVVKMGRKPFLLFYLLKLSMAFGLLALYTWYYTDRATADIYKYFDDSLIIHNLASENLKVYLKLFFGLPLDSIEHQLIISTQHWDASSLWGGSGNRMMTRLHMLIHWLSFSNIWVHAVFFNALSVLGFLWIYRSLADYFRQPLFILLAFLMPTVLFWSSGMLKEALLVFFIGMLFNAFYLLVKKQMKGAMLFTLVSIGGIAVLKFYLLLAAFPLVLAFLFTRLPLLRHRSCLWSVLIALPVSVILFYLSTVILFEMSLTELLMLRYNEFYELAIAQNAGSLLSGSVSSHDFWDWFFRAFRHTWLMPWPWHGGGFLIKLAGLEHLLFLFLLMVVIIVLLRLSTKPKHLFIFSFLFLYGILLFQLIGLSVPVLGAIVRYKMPGLMMAMLFILYIVDWYCAKSVEK